MLLCSGVIEADVVEYQTATALINFLDFHFILQGSYSIVISPCLRV